MVKKRKRKEKEKGERGMKNRKQVEDGREEKLRSFNVHVHERDEMTGESFDSYKGGKITGFWVDVQFRDLSQVMLWFFIFFFFFFIIFFFSFSLPNSLRPISSDPIRSIHAQQDEKKKRNKRSWSQGKETRN